MDRSLFSTHRWRPALAVVAVAAAFAVAPAVQAQGRVVTENVAQHGEYRLGSPGLQVSYTAPVRDPRDVVGFAVGGIKYNASVTIASDAPGSVRGRLEVIDASGKVLASRERSAAAVAGSESQLHFELVANRSESASSVRVTYESLSGDAIVLRDASVKRSLSDYAFIENDFGSDD